MRSIQFQFNLNIVFSFIRYYPAFRSICHFVSKSESQSGHPSISQSAFSTASSTPLISFTAITQLCAIYVDGFGYSLTKAELTSQEYSESKSNDENHIFINLIDNDLKHRQDNSPI
jgi:hypothetical protein